MFRVLSILSVSAIVAAGCALDPPAPIVMTKTVTKVVPVNEPASTCRIETRPMTSAEFCAKKKNCPEIETCAEVYYRLTVCGHRWLDGGTAVRGEPNRRGEPDGIPCEKGRCGAAAHG
jgi:hypothetical protein